MTCAICHMCCIFVLYRGKCYSSAAEKEAAWSLNAHDPGNHQYSALHTLEDYRDSDGSFTLRLEWPLDELRPQIWRQKVRHIYACTHARTHERAHAQARTHAHTQVNPVTGRMAEDVTIPNTNSWNANHRGTRWGHNCNY